MDSSNKSPGTLILNGKYEVLSVLGKGGFGEVYQVKEVGTSKLFAAKKMKIDEKDDLEIANSEILLYSNKFTHPNIVSVIEHHKTQDEFIFIMELGLYNLKQEMDRIKLTDANKKKRNKPKTRGVYTFPQALSIFKDLLNALMFVTSKNIHYGDIKPTNIIKFPDCYKLTDWGTASFKHSGVDRTVTVKSSRLIVGTLLYMAPELQECLEKDINLSVVGKVNKQKIRINFEKADVFSLGLLVLEVYFGVSKANIRKIKMKVQQQKISLKEMEEVLLKCNKDCDLNFCKLVSVMLSLDHTKRPHFKDVMGVLGEMEGALVQSVSINSVNGEATEEEKREEDPTEKLEKIRKNSREKDHASSVGQEDDLFSLTELLKQNANHVENIEYQVNTLRKLNKRSLKYSSVKFLRWNKFLDFELNPEMVDLLKNDRHYKIVSVSGKSGVGKSTSMNMLINILSQYEHITSFDYELKYVEIFKVGDGMHGTTDGLDFNIVRIDEDNSLIIIDLQGNNDKRGGKQWKFLYFSLFYTIFLISDYHFYFYDGNLEDIEQSELKSVISQKEKIKLIKKDTFEAKVWNRTTELVLVKKFDKKTLKGIKLQTMVKEHANKAKFVYSEQYFRGQAYFCRQNEHFDKLEEDICLNDGKICNECRKSDAFETFSQISEYLYSTMKQNIDGSRKGVEILEDLHYILKEVQESRYLICLQVGKDLIEEYLCHAHWCYQLKSEKIDKYDFVNIFKKLFGEDFFAENPLDENRLQQIDKLARNFGQIYLISIEFRKFIENNLEEHGNNILRKQEVEFIQKVFIAKFEDYYKDFIYLLKFYLESEKFTKPDFAKTIKNRLKDIYTNIKAQKISEKVEKKVSFCDLLFKKNKREGIIYYLLLNEDSIQEIMKSELMDNDKFEYTHAICGLKFAELLIGAELQNIVQLEKNLDLLIINTKKEAFNLSVEIIKPGFGKNKEMVKCLYRIKKILEEFINQHETKLKILID